MTELNLEIGESVLLQTNEAGLYDGKKEIEIDELYLTNKNIILVHEKSVGFFKWETAVDKIPLTSIAVASGNVQIQQVDDDEYGKTLQIIYNNGKRELLELYNSPKKQYPIWKSAITDAVLAAYNVVVSAPQTQPAPQVVRPAAVEEQRNETKPIFCSNCGTKLNECAKFCHGCGVPISTGNPPIATPPETKTVLEQFQNKPAAFEQEGVSQRKTAYDGEIHKCPNCGDIIDAYEIVCESCGYEIRGREASRGVRELVGKLENTSDAQLREALVRNFYIPNTKEDVCEFFILAFSNIEAGGNEAEAWFAKLEQAYQKIRLLFSASEDFAYFQDLYKKAQEQRHKQKVLGFIFGNRGPF